MVSPRCICMDCWPSETLLISQEVLSLSQTRKGGGVSVRTPDCTQGLAAVNRLWCQGWFIATSMLGTACNVVLVVTMVAKADPEESFTYGEPFRLLCWRPDADTEWLPTACMGISNIGWPHAKACTMLQGHA
jgi:hypothetical protein